MMETKVDFMKEKRIKMKKMFKKTWSPKVKMFSQVVQVSTDYPSCNSITLLELDLACKYSALSSDKLKIRL